MTPRLNIVPTQDEGTEAGSKLDRGNPDLAAQLDSIEDALLLARQSGDQATEASLGEHWLRLMSPSLGAFRDRLESHLHLLRRDQAWSVWADDGAWSYRLRVALVQVDVARAPLAITYWIREGSLGMELLSDHEDAVAPTDYALRTLRLFPAGAYGAKRIEHLIVAQVSIA